MIRATEDNDITKKTHKVLHVITISGIAGAEKLLVDLLPEQYNLNFEVHCLLFHKKLGKMYAQQLGDKLNEHKIKVYYKEYSRIIDKKVFSFLKDLIYQIKPDLIHSHLKQADVWLSILKWRKKISVPVVATLHSYSDEYHNRYGLTWNKKAKYTFYYWLTKFICNELDAFISISKGIANLFLEAGLLKDDKITVVYHGTKIEEGSREEGLKPFNWKLVLVGRLVHFKGHHYAIEAVSFLQEKYPHISLDFFGAGPEEHNLKQKIKKLGLQGQIHFNGFKADIVQHLKEYDIALIPSIGEPFGLVFFDAFKACLPVVAFNLAASNEIIKHGINGLLAKPYDSKHLGEQIDILFKDQELRSSIARNAKKILKEDFNIQKIAAFYLAEYKKIIAGKYNFGI